MGVEHHKAGRVCYVIALAIQLSSPSSVLLSDFLSIWFCCAEDIRAWSIYFLPPVERFNRAVGTQTNDALYGHAAQP